MNNGILMDLYGKVEMMYIRDNIYKLFIFHPNTEELIIEITCDIREMEFSEDFLDDIRCGNISIIDC